MLFVELLVDFPTQLTLIFMILYLYLSVFFSNMFFYVRDLGNNAKKRVKKSEKTHKILFVFWPGQNFPQLRSNFPQLRSNFPEMRSNFPESRSNIPEMRSS